MKSSPFNVTQPLCSISFLKFKVCLWKSFIIRVTHHPITEVAQVGTSLAHNTNSDNYNSNLTHKARIMTPELYS